jgi:hypothetical protein
MYYGLIGTLFLLYVGWMLKSRIESMDESATD